jgi:hypothetical protein
MELLDPDGELDRLGRVEPPVDLDIEVDLVTDRVAVGGDRLDRVADLGGVALEIRLRAVLVQERCQVADRRETLLLGFLDVVDELLPGRPDDVMVDASPVADLATEQRVDGRVAVLPG